MVSFEVTCVLVVVGVVGVFQVDAWVVVLCWMPSFLFSYLWVLLGVPSLWFEVFLGLVWLCFDFCFVCLYCMVWFVLFVEMMFVLGCFCLFFLLFLIGLRVVRISFVLFSGGGFLVVSVWCGCVLIFVLFVYIVWCGLFCL